MASRSYAFEFERRTWACIMQFLIMLHDVSPSFHFQIWQLCWHCWGKCASFSFRSHLSMDARPLFSCAMHGCGVDSSLEEQLQSWWDWHPKLPDTNYLRCWCDMCYVIYARILLPYFFRFLGVWITGYVLASRVTDRPDPRSRFFFSAFWVSFRLFSVSRN